MPRAAELHDARLDQVFAALADPIRRGIVARLAQGEATVGELRLPYDVSAPAVSRHLRVLESAGLVAQARDGRFRRTRLRPEGMAQATDWLERYRVLWDSRLDRLEAHLRERTAHESPADRP